MKDLARLKTKPLHCAIRGRALAKNPNYPEESNRRYKMSYRVVVERALGRELKPDEVVHHVNGDGQDNRLENLQVMSSSDHCKLHAQIRPKRTERLPPAPRETEVWELGKQGYSSSQIAKTLGISLRTVDTHRFNMRQKLGAPKYQRV